MPATHPRGGATASAHLSDVDHGGDTEHLHSAIGFVTPQARHVGADLPILAHRRLVYEQAHAKHPERWTGNIRPWDRPEVVHLNPDRPAITVSPNVGKAA